MTSHVKWDLLKEFPTLPIALREIEKLRNEIKLLKDHRFIIDPNEEEDDDDDE